MKLKQLTWTAGLLAALALAPACGDDDDGGEVDAPTTQVDGPPTDDVDAAPDVDGPTGVDGSTGEEDGMTDTDGMQ